MKITVLAGGVGGARFLLGVKAFLGRPPFGAAPDDGHDLTAVVNTADDIVLHGLQVCTDLDSCLYTLSGAADLERGWGRQDETWNVAAELAAYGAEAPWFSLGDKDLATHLVRTRMLSAGYPLSQVTAALAAHRGTGATLLPMTDDRVETHVTVEQPLDPQDPSAGTELVALHFQEWWIKHRAALPARRIEPIGADLAQPGPGVLSAIRQADLVLLAPSNPVVSIGTILAVPGIAEAVRATAAPVVGISPIIGGAPVRGHADHCLTAIGVETSAEAVGRHYASRRVGGLIDGWLIDEQDEAEIPGVAVGKAPLLMTDPEATAAMVRAAAALVPARGAA